MKELSREEFEQLLSGAARVMKTRTRPLAIPGEAILGIEAIARCTACKGRRFVNIATWPYGEDFGRWLRECGAEVLDVAVPVREAVQMTSVRDAVERFRPDGLAYVYAEAVTGIKNPVQELQDLAREFELFTIVDAVSSFGADPFEMDAWGVDFVSLGMQKALGGSNGLSFLGISDRGMEWIRQNPSAPRHSLLSLPEIQELEKDGVPAWLPVLEARDTLRAFEENEKEGGIEATVRRHGMTARKFRETLTVQGWKLFPAQNEYATDLDTTLLLDDKNAADFEGEGIIHPVRTPEGQAFLRVNHYGSACNSEEMAKAEKILQRLMEK
ncbi:MAG: alanine--glyoxylate aminotransferase family protein [Blautia sp.]|nr:alanine--glyoxylate aminotransferase family protein [Blautia sp.]